MLPLKNREINPPQITLNLTCTTLIPNLNPNLNPNPNPNPNPIDHVLTELDECFSAVNKSIINVQLLLPKNF